MMKNFWSINDFLKGLLKVNLVFITPYLGFLQFGYFVFYVRKIFLGSVSNLQKNSINHLDFQKSLLDDK